jgi:hexosaminidase
MRYRTFFTFVFVACFCLGALAPAQMVTELWSRGYSIVPTPRTVELGDGDIQIDGTWVVDAARVGERSIAFRTLMQDFQTFHGVALKSASRSNSVIRLSVVPGTVATKAAAEIDRQAYRLKINDSSIEITGNGDPGLFYGVQSLLQLAKRDSNGRLVVPKGTIEDWPTFQLRFLHWDTKHHQDRIETLKRYLDWAARLKVNMIGFELEDKFEYPSHPVIGAPGAFTTQQLQEIVSYGLERYIQVVPQIQAPAHLAYVLKHPEFADLRSDGNNYMACLCDDRSYDLIFSMYDDVIKATKGVNYVFVSTDEVYYAGICKKCDKPYNPVNRSLKWVEFVQRAHDFLAKRGRKMLIWAEYPLLPEHVKLLPPDIIDGVMGNPGYTETENKLGMRQLAYTSMQGAERLFPDNLSLETDEGLNTGRLQEAMETISNGRVWRANPIGVYGAAWDDCGLHNETFWLGWSAVAQYGWTKDTPAVEQHVAEFMNLYYGPNAAGMVEIYRSLQRQARGWQQTWDRVRSRVRGEGYAHWDGRKGVGDALKWDLTLSAPPIPALPDLKVQPSFAEKYSKYIDVARARILENEQLIQALQANFVRVDRNRYSLEVFLSLTKFIRHHWNLITGLADAEQSLQDAQIAAAKNDYRRAVGQLVSAQTTVKGLQAEGEEVFKELVAVYEKSRYPKGQSVGGRKFVHILDDTKDHWADRTADMGFMMQPERSIGLDAWQKELLKVTEAYAKEQNVPVRGGRRMRPEE